MSVVILGTEEMSIAQKAGILPEDILVSINGHDIMDVLDFRFYQNESKLKLLLLRDGKRKRVKIKKAEYEEIGLKFETYLMDKQHSCRNKCIFCFIDQMPKGMRESLYFKDDDSRLSFLFGNYITLTNITEHEVERIINMHISPVNISVHTTNPTLRVKMMNNRFAGEALEILDRFNSASIAMNCQLVLCPGWNDGDELRRSLEDLLSLENVGCIACVPVGLTKYREGLQQLEPFCKETAANVIDIIDEFAEKALSSRGERICYASDEFYLKAERELPPPEFYGDFLQLENGVGMLTLLKSECDAALKECDAMIGERHIAIITGVAAAPTLQAIVDKCQKKWHNFKCEVYPIKNNFFGEMITVSGLVTGTDIIAQLKDKVLPREVLIPSSMLRQGEDCFLDDITVAEIEKELNVKIRVVDNDGYELISTFVNSEEGEE